MNIYNCNNDKLGRQKEYLKNEIKSGNNKDYFKIIDLECGTGKTIVAEETFAEYMEEKILFVRERNADAIESANRINKLAGKTIAIAVNSDTHNVRQFNKIKETLKNYKVVIISHEKYKALAVDKVNRKYFIEDRNILVIDEFLNITKGNNLVINRTFIDTFEIMLSHRTLRGMYVQCVQEIEDYLMSDKKLHSFFNSKQEYKSISKKINKLKAQLRKTLSKEQVKSIGYTKKGLCKKLEELKQFYLQTCVVEGEFIYCIDKTYDYWFLENNVMLDASAKINKSYELSDKFKIQHQSKVLDHKEWSFFIFNSNSCKKAKERAVNFYSVVNNLVNTHGIDNTLVIGNKNDENFIKANYINHIGNVTGSNEYRELINIILTHNPNIPYRAYVLEYLYFSREKLDNRNTWDGNNEGSGNNIVYRFQENKFEEYRQSRNANELYQALKE